MAAHIVAVGDVMPGRFVEVLMKQLGADYPFRRIAGELQGDMVIGNLEGPIVTDHVPTPVNSMKFLFRPETAGLLRNAGFTHLTLGNNHAADAGPKGLSETRSYLRRARVMPVGDPLSLSAAFTATTTVRGVPLAFLSMNDTYGRHAVAEAAEAVRALRAREPEAFLLAFIHWGEEYVHKPNDHQRELGAALIGAGADAVVGHHPHVTQSVEMVSGKPVFYSLGNFVFDQYFSPETEEGLLLRMDISAEEAWYELVPIVSRRSQPVLADEETARRILDGIAGWNGTITVAR